MNQTVEMKEFAAENSVPIIKEASLNFILDYIKTHNVKRILEIGSAIGYSAINFAKVRDDIFVDTVEYDIERYKIAVKNIAENSLMDRITIFLGDAASFDFKDKYDLIFIDGPKAQNMKFFIKFQKNLADGGVIITDNLAFHGMVEDRSLTHNYSTIKMVRKIARYVTFLKENPEFETEFYDIGDTISVSRKNLKPDFTKYLAETDIIDFSSDEVQKVCAQFEHFRETPEVLAEKAFYFVKDNFPCSPGHKVKELSIKASDVIKNGHGLSFAKAHLYAAILRNFKIPAGFCYQILKSGNDEKENADGRKRHGHKKNHFFPHGFNAVYFENLKKWVHLDVSAVPGGKQTVFSLDEENDRNLCFEPDYSKYEVELPLNFTNPFNSLIECMKKCQDKNDFFKHQNDLSESIRAFYQSSGTLSDKC